MAERRPWSPNELLLAFRLYCRTPFGKLHQHNPIIIELSQRIDRTPAAVAMKACNFASLDPVQQARGISALGNVSQGDRDLWERFMANPESVAAEAEAVADELLTEGALSDDSMDYIIPSGPTEVERIVRTRRVQSFFRMAVLTSYGNRCAITGLHVRSLLNASHIIPWGANEARRADPTNGICLNALYDRAFDRGLITFDDQLRMMLSPALRNHPPDAPFHQSALTSWEGTQLRMPERFAPDPAALAHHRDHIFKSQAA